MDKFNYNYYLKLKNIYNKRVNILSSLRLIVFVIMVLSFFISSSYSIFFYVGLLLFVLFLVMIFIHDFEFRKLDYYNKCIIVIDEYKKRINGDWKEFSDKGIEYDNDLFGDLDIVGDNSLFQYLSICTNKGSRDKFIKRLSNNKISKNELISNQEVVLELSKKIDFCIDYQVKMFEYRESDIDFKEGFKYLNKSVGNRIIDLVTGIIFSLFCIFLLILGLFGIVSLNYFYVMFLFNFFINYMYSFIYSSEFNSINVVSSLYSKLIDVCNLLVMNVFSSGKLNSITSDIKKSIVVIKRIEFINNLNNLKNNVLSSFIFNGLFSINIIVMYLYSRYQNNSTNDLKKGISDIEDIEVFISLANMGIINDNVCMPVLEEDVNISFKDLRHPLIDSKKCVGNDFSSSCGVNIITGSNMGGKTTFIRTIGINLLLMNAGSFVCASKFSSSYFKIFTSICVSDDISKGISTFYNELLRINEAIKYKDGNRIVLVDEIFKGTNYNDRIYGAISVIKKLNDKKTILFVTTHDFELCDIDNINNYYVKEYYEGDNIVFDYKIRKGKCTSTNAKYLMSKLGIID